MKHILLFVFAIMTSTFAVAQNTPAASGTEPKACCAKDKGTTGTATCNEAKATATTTGMLKKKSASATLQTAQFQVWGNCGMCKKTIETAATSVAGVSAANWNNDTHQFTVSFDPALTTVDKVHEVIAAAGYDTDKVKANDTAYNNLHGCCQYERKQ